MKYRLLGRTGLQVSSLALGTAALGIEYGIPAPGGSAPPTAAAAEALIRHALDGGVTLIDTAPAYGGSESLVGRIAGRNPRVVIATKVKPSDVDESLERSRLALNRDVLDIVQIHNADPAMVMGSRVTDQLLEARARGVVRFLGASVYGVDAALAVVRAGVFDVLQVAFNVLDQRMARAVLPEAAAAGVGVVARSAVLKGVLTEKAQSLPAEMARQRSAADRARQVLASGSWSALASAATRFCLSTPAISSVLIGARTPAELTAALEAEAAGPLDPEVCALAESLAVSDESILDPSTWPLP